MRVADVYVSVSCLTFRIFRRQLLSLQPSTPHVEQFPALVLRDCEGRNGAEGAGQDVEQHECLEAGEWEHEWKCACECEWKQQYGEQWTEPDQVGRLFWI